MDEQKVESGRELDKTGNVQRASEIFFEHGDFIRTVISHKIHDENKVEDLFQDFFVSLASNPIPPDIRNIKSFIYKALINDITDRARSVARYRNLTHKFADFRSGAVNNSTVADALIEKEQTEKMMELIGNRATKSEARAIALKYRDDLSIGEVAGRMDIDKRSVSRYISAGIRKVRQFIAFEQGD